MRSGPKPIDPRLKKIPVGYKLPRWLVEWIREQPESAAVLIEEALKACYGIEPPTEKRK